MITHTLRHALAPASASLLRAMAVLLCALALCSWTPAVSAHAALVASTPAAGEVLPGAPTQAQLVFNEPVSPLVLKIIQPDGTAIDLRQVQTLPDGLQLSLPELVQQGAYALSWRVVSADGHPVGGTVIFSLGAAGASPALAASTQPGRAFLIWLSRLGWYAGLFFGIGLAGCRALNAARPGARRLGLWMLALAAIATLLNVGLLGIDALDLPLSGLLGADAWQAAGATSFALSAALALAALGCAAATWRVASVFARRLAAGLAIILLGA
ncbi:MAG: copper resistance protein CopC, partial [Pusillimonas sp.]